MHPIVQILLGIALGIANAWNIWTCIVYWEITLPMEQDSIGIRVGSILLLLVLSIGLVWHGAAMLFG